MKGKGVVEIGPESDETLVHGVVVRSLQSEETTALRLRARRSPKVEEALLVSLLVVLRLPLGNREIEESLLRVLVFGSFGSTLRDGEIEESLPGPLGVSGLIVIGSTLRKGEIEEPLLLDVATEDAAEESGVAGTAELGSAVEQALVVVVSVPREDVAEQTLVVASGNLGTAVEQAFLHTVATHTVSGTVDIADLGSPVEESLGVGLVFVFGSSKDTVQETAVVLTVVVIGVSLTVDLGAAIEKTLLMIDVPSEDVSEQAVGVVETDFDLVLLTLPLDTAFGALSVTGKRHATVAGDHCKRIDVCERPKLVDGRRRTRRPKAYRSCLPYS